MAKRRDGDQKPQLPQTAVAPARAAAFSILTEVASGSRHSDDLLHGTALERLSVVDRALATTLVLGVLRWQIALDGRIRGLLTRPDAALPLPVATAMRLGAFQLLHLDRIPPHAAIHESVELTRAAGHDHASGLVNAVLRKISVSPSPKPRLYETPAALAERLAHPAWLVERWVAHFGRVSAAAICEHDQAEPVTPSLFAPLPSLSAELPTTNSVSVGATGSPLRIDDGSRLVAELAAAAHPAPRRVWDCCAAPGGKTLVLLARHPEAELLATDVSSHRLQALAQRLRVDAPRAHASAITADARQLPADHGKFDLILCDVPCSGTGTLARNPEIRLRLEPADLRRQADRQRAILMAALDRLAPGGSLVYSSCSLEPEENEAVVDAALAAQPPGLGVRAIDGAPLLEQIRRTVLLPGQQLSESLVLGGRLRTLPGFNFPGDGFFAAVFARSPA